MRWRIVPAVLLGVLASTAARPAPAQSTTVYFQPGVSTTSYTGDVGRYASGSLGVVVTQGVQFGPLGAFVSLGTDFHLTNQPPPPYTRGLQTFTIATGLRLEFPLRPFAPILGVEYANLGVVSNTLNRFTGDRLSFNAVGGHVAGRWHFLDPLYVEAQVGARYYVDMRAPTAGIGGVVAIGLSGTIQSRRRR